MEPALASGDWSVGDLQPTERALKLTSIGLALDPTDSPAIDSLRGGEKCSCSKAFALCGTWTRSEGGGCGDLLLQTEDLEVPSGWVLTPGLAQPL